MSRRLLTAADSLASSCNAMKFSPPVSHVYCPLTYARDSHRMYLQKFGSTRKRALFVGMNPGPWGMAQTGIPFGEVAAVRDWMNISAPVSAPPDPHPRRPVLGFSCPRSEVSGRRLWGMFADKYPRAEDFFCQHFVLNYCPLLFLSANGANLTPDKLPAAEQKPLFAACDQFFHIAVDVLRPQFIIGVGAFAEGRMRSLIGEASVCIGKILHPSPASPAANKNFVGTAQNQLKQLGVWS